MEMDQATMRPKEAPLTTASWTSDSEMRTADGDLLVAESGEPIGT